MHYFLFEKLKWAEGLEQDSPFDHKCGVSTAVKCWRKFATTARIATLVRAAHPHFRVRATLGSSVLCLSLFDCQPRSQFRSQSGNQTRTGESSYRYQDFMRCCCSDRPFKIFG
jgi:hypothetical protein